MSRSRLFVPLLTLFGRVFGYFETKADERRRASLHIAERQAEREFKAAFPNWKE